MSLSFYADGVENPANLARIKEAAALLGATCSPTLRGRVLALENLARARPIYGRRPLRDQATIVVGNERRGLSERTLGAADETLMIPTQSRTIKTLNVAAAAAVAAWYVLHGSEEQSSRTRPDDRRPAVLLVGEDHIEVGSTLRSAAAFGFRDVMLEDRGAGWFEGSASTRREARAAARRHRNPLRIHRAALAATERFDEVVVVVPSGRGRPIQRQALDRGQRQIIVIGAKADEVTGLAVGRSRVSTLELVPNSQSPLRLVASIALAEIARQVGRRRRIVGGPAPRPPSYKMVLELASTTSAVTIDHADLIDY